MIFLYLLLAVIIITVCLLVVKYPVSKIKIVCLNIPLNENIFKAIVISFLIMMSCGIYLKLGYYDKIDKYYFYKNNIGKINQVLDNITAEKKIENMIQKKIKSSSSNDASKLLLAKIRIMANKKQLAANILDTINYEDLSLNELQSYIETKYYITQKLDDTDLEFCMRILTTRPHNTTILSIIISDSFMKHDYKKSLDFQNKLIPLLNEESDDYNEVIKINKLTKQHLQH